MSKLYLNTYLNKVKDCYKETHKEYENLNKQILELENSWNKSRFSKNLTAQGKENAGIEYRSKRSELDRQLEALINEFKDKVKSIREKADKVFGDKYKLNPEQLDINTVKLIDAGVTTDKELIEMCEKYQDNYTMLRYIKNEADKRAEIKPNKELAMLSARISDIEVAPHLSAIDTLEMWYSKALGTNYAVSEAFDKSIEENTAHIFESYGSISAEA